MLRRRTIAAPIVSAQCMNWESFLARIDFRKNLLYGACQRFMYLQILGARDLVAVAVKIPDLYGNFYLMLLCFRSTCIFVIAGTCAENTRYFITVALTGIRHTCRNCGRNHGFIGLCACRVLRCKTLCRNGIRICPCLRHEQRSFRLCGIRCDGQLCCALCRGKQLALTIKAVYRPIPNARLVLNLLRQGIFLCAAACRSGLLDIYRLL